MADYKPLLDLISKRYKEILSGNLVGIYVHGSIAFGCFNPEKSDIDFIVVVNEPLSQQTKLELLQALEELRGAAPKKGFEMSVVLKKYCTDFEYPTPYELHFSNAWLERYLENPLSLCGDEVKTDCDLAAHFTVIKRVGIVLCGSEVCSVFAGVPKEHYIDSICLDIKNAKTDITGNPVYVILNLCRVLAYIKDGLILSKEQGGMWGLKNLPKRYGGLVTSALDSYLCVERLENNRQERLEADFCEYMTRRIFRRSNK